MSKIFITPDEIAFELGMKSFAEFEFEHYLTLHDRLEKEPRAQVIRERHRRTGRTTKKIFEAICHLSQNEYNRAAFVADRAQMSVLMCEDAKGYCVRLNIPLSTKYATSRVFCGCVVNWATVTSDIYFYDHPLL